MTESKSNVAPFFEEVIAATNLNAPKFINMQCSNCEISFTMTNTNVSLANCMRRTIMADIPIVVMRTSPYHRNQCTIFANTSRFHNEICLHRLSCIPVFMQIEDALKYELVLDVQNETNKVISVTTQDFKLRNVSTKDLISAEDTRRFFPPSQIDGEDFYIEFIRLRPRIAAPALVPGEKISLICKFDIGTAAENAAFNVVHKCHFTNTVDNVAADAVWEQTVQTLRETLSPEEISFKKKNFDFLDRKQYCTPGSFEFVIKTLGDSIGGRYQGHYNNLALMNLTCSVILERLNNVETHLNDGDTVIHKTPKTDYADVSFDIVFKHEGYTIGKLLEYLVYDLFFRGGVTKTLLYCGFVKPHPHVDDSILRMVFLSVDDASPGNVRKLLLGATYAAKDIFTRIQQNFISGEENQQRKPRFPLDASFPSSFEV